MSAVKCTNLIVTDCKCKHLKIGNNTFNISIPCFYEYCKVFVTSKNTVINTERYKYYTTIQGGNIQIYHYDEQSDVSKGVYYVLPYGTYKIYHSENYLIIKNI